MDEALLAQIPASEAIKAALRDLSRDYVIDRWSPKGANGYVFFGKDRVLGRKVAIKFYYWGGERQFHAEPQALAAIASPNVAPVYHAGIGDEDWAYFVTPFFEGGDLDDLLSVRIPGVHEALQHVEGILHGLSHLHAGQFVHRDIKTENIFLSEAGEAVIGDFGSVRRMPEAGASVPGSGMTILYTPPETCTTGEYAVAGDIYQTGVLMFRLLNGPLPYDPAAWLNPKQKQEYGRIADPFEQSRYIDDVLRAKIVRGGLIEPRKVANWIPAQVVRVLRTAVHVNLNQRFESTTAFLAQLQRVRRSVPDWHVTADGLEMRAGQHRRKLRELRPHIYEVLKPWGAKWQKDSRFAAGSESDVCGAINSHFSS